jgi:hypothetical protein
LSHGERLRIISADSSSAILNQKFEPLLIVATASVLTTPPYREATTFLAEPIFVDVQKGHDVIVHEAELCREMLSKTKADVVHLDMSLGSVPLEQLSPIQFSNMNISAKAKRHLLNVLPRLRKIGNEMTQKYGVEVLAIGKESMPVRIAELTSGAHAILYACKKAIQEKQNVMLGLPSRCQPRPMINGVYLYSLMAAEHDVRGFAEDTEEVLKKVNISELLNPIARGFRTLKIVPKGAS